MSFLLRYGGRVLNISAFRSLFIDGNFRCVNNTVCLPTLIDRRHYGDIRARFVPFDTLVNTRRCQAKRSVIIQVNSDLSFPELHSYCSQFGTVLGVYHYTILNGQQHFMLVEFTNESETSKLMSHGSFVNEPDLIPVKSSMFWFRPCQKKGLNNQIWNVLKPAKSSENLKLSVINGCEITTEADVQKRLKDADSISHQIQTLYEMTCLNDLGTRLRYMVARQVENALIGLYPEATVRPFGSTVNGFGKMGCDLDLLLRFSADIEQESAGRLVFHTKKSMATARNQQQRFMEVISDIIQLFLPGCSHVRRILQARIPIIKYNQDYAGLECDLSMSSMTGVYMSELLYIYGCFDERVKPLVFTVRKWAQNVGITNPSPGRWITNFPLTLMVLYFLQNTSDGAILPSFNQLKNDAGKIDKRLTDDLVNCTFQRDIRLIAKPSENGSSLEALLHQFFEFYSKFDFSVNGISINEGKAVRKPDHSPLYIINPLEVNLNVSKNVSIEECERLRIELRNAAWQMESFDEKQPDAQWGLALLFRLVHKNSPKIPNMQPHSPSNRLVAVKDLFRDEYSQRQGNTDENFIMNSLQEEILEMTKENQTDKVHFKNSEVKKHVLKIQKEMADNNQRMKKKIVKEPGVNELGTLRRKTRRR